MKDKAIFNELQRIILANLRRGFFLTLLMVCGNIDISILIMECI